MTKILIKTEHDPVIVYDQDGETQTIDANSEVAIELTEQGFCTISESPDTRKEDFVENMVNFWQGIRDAIKDQIPHPEQHT